MEKFQTIVDNMPQELYDAFIIDDDNPLSFENLQLFKSRFLNADSDDEVQMYMTDIVKHFTAVANRIFELTNEKEDQLMFLERFII